MVALFIFMGAVALAFNSWVFMLVWGMVASWFDAPTISYIQSLQIQGAFIGLMIIPYAIIAAIVHSIIENS